MRALRVLGGVTVASVAIGLGVRELTRRLIDGRVHLDVGIGRRLLPLGPQVIEIAAPVASVFAAAMAPYQPRPPRAMKAKVEVTERGDTWVVATHRTTVSATLTAVTVERVDWVEPHQLRFELLRGPVPMVVETFTLEATATGTRLTYSGELGTDFWVVGSWWGAAVAKSWEASVAESLATIKSASER